MPFATRTSGSRRISTLSSHPERKSPPAKTPAINTVLAARLPKSTERTSTFHLTRHPAKSWMHPALILVVFGAIALSHPGPAQEGIPQSPAENDTGQNFAVGRSNSNAI